MKRITPAAGMIPGTVIAQRPVVLAQAVPAIRSTTPVAVPAQNNNNSGIIDLTDDDDNAKTPAVSRVMSTTKTSSSVSLQVSRVLIDLVLHLNLNFILFVIYSIIK